MRPDSSEKILESVVNYYKDDLFFQWDIGNILGNIGIHYDVYSSWKVSKLLKKTSCPMGYWDIPSLKLTARTSKMEILEDY